MASAEQQPAQQAGGWDDWGGSGGDRGGKDGGWGGKGGERPGPYGGGKGGKAWRGSGGAAAPSAQLYVSSLPGDATAEELEHIFNQYGVVQSVKIVWQDKSGTAAVVSYQSVEEATEVKNALHSNLPQGLERSP